MSKIKKPYLLVNFIERPAPNANTSKKGWQNEPNSVKIFEQVSVVDSINSKNMLSSIIIDLVDGTCSRNVSAKSDTDVVSHYTVKYADTIKRSLKAWAEKAIHNG